MACYSPSGHYVRTMDICDECGAERTVVGALIHRAACSQRPLDSISREEIDHLATVSTTHGGPPPKTDGAAWRAYVQRIRDFKTKSQLLEVERVSIDLARVEEDL